MKSNNHKRPQKKPTGKVVNKRAKKTATNNKSKPLSRYIPGFNWDRIYIGFSILVLLLTTLFWALKTAGLQLSNADQLIDPYLFSSTKVFQGAQFPGAHSFLIKWPAFYLIKLFHFSAFAYGFFTILFVLVTIGGLVWLIYKIESRPLYFSAIILALSSVLLLIPAQPSAGTLLPVNMAMLTTRNIEYLFYIVSLVLIARSNRLLSRPILVATILQTLLFASDKMFLYISLGGAFITLLVFALNNSWSLVSLSTRWLCTSFASSIAAISGLLLINAFKITHIVSAHGSGPYGIISSLHNLILGVIYSVGGLLTNFGANPAYSEGVLRMMPQQFVHNLISLGLIAFIVNLVLVGLGVYSVFVVLKDCFGKKKHKPESSPQESLGIMLIASTITAFALFVATNHYYFADSRYLSIVLFTFFITGALALKRSKLSSNTILISSGVICMAIVSGILFSGNEFSKDAQALSSLNAHNHRVLSAFESQPESVLVGNYWRVVPIKFLSGQKTINILPVSDCSGRPGGITSNAWNFNFNRSSFAYLLQLKRGPGKSGNCNLSDAIRIYGRPSSSVVISGSIEKPSDLLIYYNHGIYKPKSIDHSNQNSIAPISLNNLSTENCQSSEVNIVAHQDDDLLFINPDIIDDIKSGDCIRTIYVTAGDAGQSKYYWLNRQLGSEAAYDYMTNSKKSDWVDHIVKLADNEYIDVDSPSNNNKVSLIFMHLPDGGLRGQGFRRNNLESLAKLYYGQITAINTVDGQSTYTASELTSALTKLMQFYQPNLVRTQANYISSIFPDHSDHMTVGDFVKRAVSAYDPSGNGLSVKYYIGYPIHAFAPNLTSSQFQEKLNTFLTYTAFDPGACQTVQRCEVTRTYDAYLNREYLNTN